MAVLYLGGHPRRGVLGALGREGAAGELGVPGAERSRSAEFPVRLTRAGAQDTLYTRWGAWEEAHGGLGAAPPPPPGLFPSAQPRVHRAHGGRHAQAE
jgi:hypothetical protein